MTKLSGIHRFAGAVVVLLAAASAARADCLDPYRPAVESVGGVTRLNHYGSGAQLCIQQGYIPANDCSACQPGYYHQCTARGWERAYKSCGAEEPKDAPKPDDPAPDQGNGAAPNSAQPGDGSGSNAVPASDDSAAPLGVLPPSGASLGVLPTGDSLQPPGAPASSNDAECKDRLDDHRRTAERLVASVGRSSSCDLVRGANAMIRQIATEAAWCPQWDLASHASWLREQMRWAEDVERSVCSRSGAAR